MHKSNNFLNSKQMIAQSFSRAAHSYDKNAILQQEVGNRLLQRLSYTKINPSRILDLGSGTGYFSKKLSALFPDAEIISVDIAEGMLKYSLQHDSSHNKLCCADAESLPFSKSSFDLIFSNLMLQWIIPSETIFHELHYLLKPEGLLLFTSLGPDTLKELRQAWSQIDQYHHVNLFSDMHIVGDSLLQSNFIDPVIDMEMLTLTYSSVKDLMLELKLTGANSIRENRHNSLTTKSNLQKMITAYEASYSSDNIIPATFEVIYGQAWGAKMISRQTKDENGNVYIPIDAIESI